MLAYPPAESSAAGFGFGTRLGLGIYMYIVKEGEIIFVILNRRRYAVVLGRHIPH